MLSLVTNFITAKQTAFSTFSCKVHLSTFAHYPSLSKWPVHSQFLNEKTSMHHPIPPISFTTHNDYYAFSLVVLNKQRMWLFARQLNVQGEQTVCWREVTSRWNCHFKAIVNIHWTTFHLLFFIEKILTKNSGANWVHQYL